MGRERERQRENKKNVFNVSNGVLTSVWHLYKKKHSNSTLELLKLINLHFNYAVYKHFHLTVYFIVLLLSMICA